MEAVVDSVGRILVPKALRDALGLTPGSRVDVSRDGAGLHPARDTYEWTGVPVLVVT